MKSFLSIFLLLLSSSIAFCQQTSFFNADGFFSIGTQSNRTASITLFDIDKDGDLDALVANGRHWAEQNYVYYNSGKGGFKLAQAIGNYMNASYAVKAGDLNGDNINDLAVANDGIANVIYFGSADGSFTRAGSFGKIAPTRNLEIIDIDYDGDLDLILSNRKDVNEICLNDGKGNFEQSIFYGDETDQTIQTVIIDIDQDGDLDLITAERQNKNKIYLNEKELAFKKVIEFGGANDETRSVDIGDMNNDGFLDIVCGNLGGENAIYFGSKTLDFTKKQTLSKEHQTASIKIADFNNDELLDIVEGNSEEANYVYLNKGNLKFEEIILNPDLKEDTYNVTTGDINGDGLPDIIESNSGNWNLYYRTQVD